MGDGGSGVMADHGEPLESKRRREIKRRRSPGPRSNLLPAGKADEIAEADGIHGKWRRKCRPQQRQHLPIFVPGTRRSDATAAPGKPLAGDSDMDHSRCRLDELAFGGAEGKPALSLREKDIRRPRYHPGMPTTRSLPVAPRPTMKSRTQGRRCRPLNRGKCNRNRFIEGTIA